MRTESIESYKSGDLAFFFVGSFLDDLREYILDRTSCTPTESIGQMILNLFKYSWCHSTKYRLAQFIG